MMKAYTMSELNRMDQTSFAIALGAIFEQSPWVAEQAWESRPFNNKQHLHTMMMAVVQHSPEDEQLAFLRMHPDLAGRIQMSEMSVKEQEGAGLLSSLSAEEYAEFSSLNKEYTTKFGFPFIIAVKGMTKESILEAMMSRISNGFEQEMDQALIQIAKITGYRIEYMVMNDE